MLRLLHHDPAWVAEGRPDQALPMTLPAALLLVLAAQPGWQSREGLAALFWPDAEPADALHHLRINLHRSKQLLTGWGQAAALQTERARLRLDLPTDLDQLRQAQRAGDAAALDRLRPTGWLRGWRLPGHEGFGHWCDQQAEGLQADWLAASRRCLPGAAGPTTAAAAFTAAASTSTAIAPSAVAPGLALPSAGSIQSVPGACSPAADELPGRITELQRLRASPSPALLLLGEPGVGKTTLLRQVWPQSPCLQGLENLQAMPYRPLLDALRAQLPVLERALRQPAHPLRPYRLDLARALPELAPDEALPPLDALTAQTRLAEALTRAFEALTPLLLVDDLQWCDAATVEWLQVLAHSGRLRWRAAARQHEIGPALARALDSLRAALRLEDLVVPPLDAAGLAAAGRQRWAAAALDEGQLARLHALSGGNPFLAGQLVAAGWPTEGTDAATQTLPERVRQVLQHQLRRLPQAARRLVEAAAIAVQPLPLAALHPAAPAAATEGTAVHELHQAHWASAAEQALQAGLLRRDGQRLACRHDLIRQAVASGLAGAERAALHRQIGLWLAAQPEADALTIAEHWQAADEPQTALAWRHRGAEQLKGRGRFDEARALWQQVADDSVDAAQSVRARLELAALDLFDDLPRGHRALQALLAQLPAVADAAQRQQIEGRVRSALVDNRVYAGDLDGARTHAHELRGLLPALPVRERVDALEVLIELAMREPDIPGAWAMLARLREDAPQRPSLLSWEGQIHWFGGQAQAAHDALARLLARHPEYCRGLTIENDLAVMLLALGRLDEAEAMARRSLDSWRGVPHTEALSLLVLGGILTSAGRHAPACQALQQALALARAQGSAAFEAEAHVRLARSLLRQGDGPAAAAALDAAAPLVARSPEPLRVSQLVLQRVLLAAAGGPALTVDEQALLDSAAARSSHPLVQTRVCRVQAEIALMAGDAAAASAAAQRQAALASEAGLPEPLVEAWLLQLRAVALSGQRPADAPLARQAEDLARAHGLADLAADAAAWRT